MSAEGDLEVVVDGLMVPNGIAFDADDNLYVSNKSSGFPDGGKLLKFTGVASATGTPFVVPEPA